MVKLVTLASLIDIDAAFIIKSNDLFIHMAFRKLRGFRADVCLLYGLYQSSAFQANIGRTNGTAVHPK